MHIHIEELEPVVAPASKVFWAVTLEASLFGIGLTLLAISIGC